mgnify:CR=1 FL=1
MKKIKRKFNIIKNSKFHSSKLNQTWKKISFSFKYLFLLKNIKAYFISVDSFLLSKLTYFFHSIWFLNFLQRINSNIKPCYSIKKTLNPKLFLLFLIYHLKEYFHFSFSFHFQISKILNKTFPQFSSSHNSQFFKITLLDSRTQSNYFSFKAFPFFLI